MGIAIVIVGSLALAVVGRRSRPARSARDAPGRLSRETRKRDEARPSAVAEAPCPTSTSRSRRRPRTRARADEARRAIESGGPIGARAGAAAAPPVGLRAGRPRGARRHPPAVLQPVDPRRHRPRARRASASPSLGVPLAVGGRRLRRQGRRRAPRPTPRTRSTTRSRSTTPAPRPTSSPYPKDDLPKAKKVPLRPGRSSRAWRQGYVALYQKCVHLGCRVPWCESSQWFECPCHGSKYNRVGEKQGGPAPRGLDRFPLDGRRAATSSSTPASLVHRPADRHRHHRTEPRGSALCVSRTPSTAVAPRAAARMSFRTILIIINLVAIAGVLGFIVVPRRQPAAEPRAEGAREPHAVLRRRRARRRAPRAGRSASSLIALVIVVIGLLAYFIWEPFRGADGRRRLRGAVDRAGRGAVRQRAVGGTTTARQSLLCADCHGVDGGGGSATVRRQERGPALRPRPDGRRRARRGRSPSACRSRWRGRRPASARARCGTTAQQLTQIITYGRPGTPMPAWGVASGKGALNEQSIQDLVNYVESIETTPDKAQARRGRGRRRDCATTPRGLECADRARRRLADGRSATLAEPSRDRRRERRATAERQDAVDRARRQNARRRHRLAASTCSRRPTARSCS